MDHWVREVLRLEGIDKPVLSSRREGGWLLLHLLGEHEDRRYPLPPYDGDELRREYDPAELARMLVPELRAIAAGMGIHGRGLKKADLISAILGDGR